MLVEPSADRKLAAVSTLFGRRRRARGCAVLNGRRTKVDVAESKAESRSEEGGRNAEANPRLDLEQRGVGCARRRRARSLRSQEVAEEMLFVQRQQAVVDTDAEPDASYASCARLPILPHDTVCGTAVPIGQTALWIHRRQYAAHEPQIISRDQTVGHSIRLRRAILRVDDTRHCCKHRKQTNRKAR